MCCSLEISTTKATQVGVLEVASDDAEDALGDINVDQDESEHAMGGAA